MDPLSWSPFIWVPCLFVLVMCADLTKELLKTAFKLCRERHEYDT